MINNIYFIGIGGIGMSAIARYYKFKGYNVAGYDKTESELTRQLESEGIYVHYTDDVSMIPNDVENTLVVYTPAVPSELKELNYVFENRYRVIKRSKMLGEICEGQKCLAIAGTHGKTTTSTLLAHILTDSGEGCSAFLGGISKNYGTNMLSDANPVIVAEADEFDRSFHQLHPQTAVITAMDADHLDIYGDLEHYVEAFKIFASQVKGEIIIKKGLDISRQDTNAKIYTYDIDDVTADFHAENIRLDTDGHFVFDLCSPFGTISEVKSGALGRFNAENSIAAAAAALCHGVEKDKIRTAIATFKGVKRRLDEIYRDKSICYIDDYAHHPNELSTAISSIREIFPSKKITAIFQPHLYSRTRDFAAEFGKALSEVDKLILMDIYPAREEPIPGVSSELIFNSAETKEKVIVKKENLLDYLKKEETDVLISFGAGDIDRLIEPISRILAQR